MEEILAGHERAVFVCGIAWNQGELLDLSDRVLLPILTRRCRRPGPPCTMRCIGQARSQAAGRR